MLNGIDQLSSKLQVMQGFPAPWFVCGGWAIDLHLGYQTRPHHDIDLGLYRADQMLLKEHFAGQMFFYFDDDNKHIWGDEILQLPIHELRLEGEGLELEFVLNEVKDNLWHYRRNDNITLPTEELVLFTPNGVPYLAPQVVLLYKSTKVSERDQIDFLKVLPHIGLEQKDWLKSSLMMTDTEHPWLIRLK